MPRRTSARDAFNTLGYDGPNRNPLSALFRHRHDDPDDDENERRRNVVSHAFLSFLGFRGRPQLARVCARRDGPGGYWALQT